MAFASFDSQRSGAPVAEISMVPLIDVMLVLLVIFIVTAPLLTHAKSAFELPRQRRAVNSQGRQVEFAIDASGALCWNGEPVSREGHNALAAAGKQQPQPEIHLRATGHCPQARRPHARRRLRAGLTRACERAGQTLNTNRRTRRTAMKRRRKPAARRPPALLPLGALAAGLASPSAAHAQTAAPEDGKETTLAPIRVKAQAEATAGQACAPPRRVHRQRASRSCATSRSRSPWSPAADRRPQPRHHEGRAAQHRRHHFQAAEGQEEDVRLRGFALQSTGDIFLDGMRDPGFYDRDSFNWGPPGGDPRFGLDAVRPRLHRRRGQPGQQAADADRPERALDDARQRWYMRGTADFNLKTGDDSAVRLNALVSRSRQRRQPHRQTGIAPTFRWGIGTRDEFSVGLYHLQYRNGINYGFPWLQNRSARPSSRTPTTARRATPRPAAPPAAARPHVHRFAADSGCARCFAHRPLRARPRQRDPLRRCGAAAGRRGVSPATIGTGHRC